MRREEGKGGERGMKGEGGEGRKMWEMEDEC